MKNLNFKKIFAKNIFCFGDKGVEIDFESYGNITLIRGRNLDTSKDASDSKISSNGSGKSSIPELLVYGLYGQTIKSPTKAGHKDIMNHKATKGLVVEIYFNDYKLVRTRKPDSLRLWKSAEGKWDESTELTLGGMPATQAYLIDQVLGLNYKSFVNICVFTDDNSVSFLESDTKAKREIVENFLSLEKYRECFNNAKTILKGVTDNLKTLNLEINYVENSLKESENQIATIEQNQKLHKTKKIEEINLLGSQVKTAEAEIVTLEKDDSLQKYEEAQSAIKKAKALLEEKLAEQTNKFPVKDNLDAQIETFKEEKNKIQSVRNDKYLQIQNLKNEVTAIQKTLSKITNLEPGVICDHCFGEIKPENYAKVKADHEQQMSKLVPHGKALMQELAALDKELSDYNTKIAEANKEYATITSAISTLDDAVRKLRDGIVKLESVKMPDNSVKKAGLTEKIKLLNQAIEKAKNSLLRGETPYDSMLIDAQKKYDDTNKNLADKKSQFVSLKEEESLLDFWVTAFGDTGIRKFILDEIIPTFNENVNYWLNLLIENKIQVKFDNELNETITKFPDNEKPILYWLMSNGQRRRINLALSQAFAHLMVLNSGTSPSIMFLDEVTSNIDPIGVECIYQMICEIARDKKVFVTTHDQELLELLNGCSELKLVMKDGVSTLE